MARICSESEKSLVHRSQYLVLFVLAILSILRPVIHRTKNVVISVIFNLKLFGFNTVRVPLATELHRRGMLINDHGHPYVCC